MPRRFCVTVKDDGSRCQAPPLRDAEFCRMHSPEHAAEVAEARRMGGIRRRRETTLAGAYDFIGLEEVPEIRRLLEIAVFDTLALENSIARSRTLAYLSHVALRAHEIGDIDDRLKSLELAIKRRNGPRRKAS